MTVWHPVLAADEQTPGVWVLTAQTGPYAVIRLLEIAGERGYRATTYEQPRQLIGYRRTFRSACELAHQNWIRQHGPHPDPVSIYPDLNHQWEESATR